MMDHLRSAFVGIGSLCYQTDTRRGRGSQLVGLVPGRASRRPSVERLRAEEVTLGKAGTCQGPVRRIDHLVGSARLVAGVGGYHSGQVGFRLVPGPEPALVAGRALAVVVVTYGDRRPVQELHLAIEAVAPQHHQPPAPVEHPRLHLVVHLGRPVLGMGADDQHLVVVKWHLVEMQLGLGVVVVTEAFPLEPSEQPPFGRRDVFLAAALHGVGDGTVLGCHVERLGAVERERVVLLRDPGLEGRIRVVDLFLPEVEVGPGGEPDRGHVVAATAVVVVAVPVDVGRQDGEPVARFAGSDDPREREEGAGRVLGMEVVET